MIAVVAERKKDSAPDAELKAVTRQGTSMTELGHILTQFLNRKIDFPDYRPHEWESPIEYSLWNAFRYIGINTETQQTFGNYRVDIVVSSRSSDSEAIIECDGAQYHHRLIDDFRDDDLVKLAGLPIAHIYGKKIVESPERCAIYVVEQLCQESCVLLSSTIGTG